MSEWVRKQPRLSGGEVLTGWTLEEAAEIIQADTWELTELSDSQLLVPIGAREGRGYAAIDLLAARALIDIQASEHGIEPKALALLAAGLAHLRNDNPQTVTSLRDFLAWGTFVWMFPRADDLATDPYYDDPASANWFHDPMEIDPELAEFAGVYPITVKGREIVRSIDRWCARNGIGPASRAPWL